MTERLYRDDPYLLEFDAAVVERTAHESRPAVVLDRTAFYAESGGQPWDTGSLGPSRVVAVLESGDRILHVLESPLSADRVHGVVDGPRRRDHRQQHHGQHLLSQAFVRVASAETVSFHLGVESSSIDLDREVGDEALAAGEALANQVVWEARPVAVRTVTRSEAAALGLSVPDGAGDAVRLVEARGFDLQPCGGTHPNNTAEVGVVVLLGSEKHKGGTRVRFVCGDRALEGVRRRIRVLDRVGALLSAPLEAIEAALARSLDQLAAGHRQIRELRQLAIDAEAERLAATAAGSPAVVSRAYESWTPEDLRALAAAVTTRVRCVALLASRAEKAHVVFAQTPGLGCDMPGLVRVAAGMLGGRGGGRGDVAQGGGDRADQLDKAMDAARSALAADLESRQ